jgi:hypothetical protein
MSTHAKRPLPGSSSAQDEADADDGPCSSSSPPDAKRARYSSASAEQAGSLAQQQRHVLTQARARSQQLLPCLQVPRFRHTQQVVRPGVPHPIDLAHFKLADKPSPPLRDDDKVCVPSTHSPATAAPAQLPVITPHPMLPACCACRRATTATSWGRTSAQDVSSKGRRHAAGGRAMRTAGSSARNSSSTKEQTATARRAPWDAAHMPAAQPALASLAQHIPSHPPWAVPAWTHLLGHAVSGACTG